MARNSSALLRFTGSRERISGLEEKLGWRFKDRDMICAALTYHGRGTPGSPAKLFQRLEHIGDSAIRTSIRKFLFHYFPGDSTRHAYDCENNLVSNEVLAYVAEKHGLGSYIILNRNVRIGMKAEIPSIIFARCLESVMGALAIEAGEKYVDTYLYKTLFAEFDGFAQTREIL